jgi:hypothetical protein
LLAANAASSHTPGDRSHRQVVQPSEYRSRSVPDRSAVSVDDRVQPPIVSDALERMQAAVVKRDGRSGDEFLDGIRDQ